MLLLLLLLIPLGGIFIIYTTIYDKPTVINTKRIKFTALSTSILNLFISLNFGFHALMKLFIEQK